METKQAAEREKIKADAEAYAITKKAEAEAEANKLIAESITEGLIEYTQAHNWDGKLPGTYVGTGGALPIIQTGEAKSEASE